MLESIAAPERLRRLAGVYDLKDATVHDGVFDPTGPIAIRTPHARWAYAVSWRPCISPELTIENVLIAVRAEAGQGRFGLLAVRNNAAVCEVFFDAADGLQTKYLALSRLDKDTHLVVRNAGEEGSAFARIIAMEIYDNFDGEYISDPNYQLASITRQPCVPKLTREKSFAFGSFATTEVCNLSCVMCHFNGPKALKQARRLEPSTVERLLEQIPESEEVWFAATGEFFVDPHAFDHLRAAVRRGHQVGVLSHGQFYDAKMLDELLEIGVRIFRISADSIDADQFRKVRRGGELSRVIDAFTHLRSKKSEYPELRAEVTCTLLSNSFSRQQEFESFWSDKVDRLLFNAEYYNSLKFRNILHHPRRRVNCEIKTYVVPSGHIAPCCAIIVNQHTMDSSWLPHVDTHTLEEAYTELCDMYEDPDSALAKVCKSCDWWIMWAQNDRDVGSAYTRWVDFPSP